MPLTKPPPPPPKPTFDEFSTPEDFNEKFKKKEITKYMNPCAVEEKQSMKCLDVNNYDKSKCEYFFLQYRECKKNWVNHIVQKQEEEKITNYNSPAITLYHLHHTATKTTAVKKGRAIITLRQENGDEVSNVRRQ